MRKTLFHMDLSCCNLDKNHFEILVKGMKMARKLCCIHLSGNEINQRISLFKKEQEVRRINPDCINKTKGSTFITSVNQNSSKLHDFSKTNYLRLDQKERMQHSVDDINQKYNAIDVISKRIIITRILGHVEIKNSQIWKSADHCWICEKWKYSCLIINKRSLRNIFTNSNSKLHCPELISSFTQWRPKQMLTMFEFCDRVCRNNGTLYSRIAKMMNEDLYKLMKAMLLLKQGPVPAVHLVYQRQEAEKNKIKEQERKIATQQKVMKKKSNMPSKERNKYVFGNSYSSFMSNRLFVDKRSISRKSSKFVELGESKYEEIKQQIEENELSNIYSEGEEEDKVLDFKGCIDLIKTHFQKHQVYEIIPLSIIEQEYYKRLNTIDENEQSEVWDSSDYYVFVDFLPPGKHRICIGDFDLMYPKLYKNNSLVNYDNALELECVIPYQLNERPIELKRVRKQNLIRIFNKENSVFKPWKADTNKSLKLMFDLDISHSKIDKVIKDDEAYEDVKNVIFTNISKVKDVFTYCVGYSSYPLISWLDFSDFCQKWKIIDKNCSLADIDRIFIATCVSLEEGSEGKSNGLCRHQFYEIIVRIAKQKYFTPGITDSMSTAVDMILNQHILPHLSDYWEWQSWRYMELWDAKIDDFYKANMDSLKKIYASCFTQIKKFMTDKELMNIIKQSQICPNDNIMKMAFSYCKMTNNDERKDIENYYKIEFVELLEYIGRLAQMIFKDDEDRLYFKVDKVLTAIFEVFELKVKYELAEEEVFSESDNELYLEI